MGRFDVNLFILLEELTDAGQDWTELVVVHRHQINGDDGIVLMLPCGLSTKCNLTSSRPIPTMVDLQVTHEEGTWVYWEIGHVVIGNGWVAD